jgi:hypothetical protein
MSVILAMVGRSGALADCGGDGARARPEPVPIIVGWMRLSTAVHHSTGGSMRVQRLLMPYSDAESWTLHGDDQVGDPPPVVELVA